MNLIDKSKLPDPLEIADEIIKVKGIISKRLNYPYLLMNEEDAERYKLLRNAHHVVLGLSRYGKTLSATKSMFTDISSAFFHVVIIDPEGDLAKRLIQSKEIYAAYGQERFHYVGPNNPNMGLNALNPEHQINIIDLLKRVDNTEFSDTMKTPLEVCIEVCRLYGGTLFDVYNLVTENHAVRVEVGERLISDGHEKLANELKVKVFDAPKVSLAGIGNRLNKLISSPYIKRLLCSVKESFSLRKILENKVPQVLIIDLGGEYQGGNLSYEEANLVGQIMMGAIQLVSMTRTNKKQIFLYVDEAQDVLSEKSCNFIVSRGAKHGISSILITQGFTGISTQMRDRLLQTVNIIQCFQVSEQNANLISRVLSLKNHDTSEALEQKQVLDGFRYEGKIWHLTTLRKYLSVVKTPTFRGVVDYAKDNINYYSVGSIDFDLSEIIFNSEKSPLCVFQGAETVANSGAMVEYLKEWKKPSGKGLTDEEENSYSADPFGLNRNSNKDFSIPDDIGF